MALRRLARPLLGATSASELLPRVAVAGFWSSSSLRSPAAGAPTTSERLVEVTAIDPDGVRHHIKGLAGKTLLQALVRNKVESKERHPLEELGSCTGNCEVSIASEWLDKLPPRSEEEVDRLRQVSTSGKVGDNSRLGCQIVLSKDLEGITVAMAEERPWYTL